MTAGSLLTDRHTGTWAQEPLGSGLRIFDFLKPSKGFIVGLFSKKSATRKLYLLTTKFQLLMQRDTELRARRDAAIFKRFNEMITSGLQYQQIYCLLEDEFYISSSTIKQIVLRAMHAHDIQRK
jgi:hypothetical protein